MLKLFPIVWPWTLKSKFSFNIVGKPDFDRKNCKYNQLLQSKIATPAKMSEGSQKLYEKLFPKNIKEPTPSLRSAATGFNSEFPI